MTRSDFDFDVIGGPVHPPLAELLRRPAPEPAPQPAEQSLDQQAVKTETPPR